jgi:hypothetical protein
LRVLGAVRRPAGRGTIVSEQRPIALSSAGFGAKRKRVGEIDGVSLIVLGEPGPRAVDLRGLGARRPKRDGGLSRCERWKRSQLLV